MKIIGYGEDSLTISILRDRMEEFLAAVGDSTDLKDVTFLYRPSFGRGQYGFGEFDAIVSTFRNIYLIESKWHKSTEIKKGSKRIVLTKAQVRRHLVFISLFENSDESPKTNSIDNTIHGWRIPDENSGLAQNTNIVMKLLREQSKTKIIRNILLMFVPEGEVHSFDNFQVEAKYEETALAFDLKVLDYLPIDELTDGFFEMLP